MFPLRPLLLMLSTGLLAACAVGPDYFRPDVTLAEHYMTESAVLNRNAPHPASFDRWWEGFNDPLLSKLVTDSLAQNLDLAQAAARMTQSDAVLGAATAALLPSANVSGQTGRSYQSTETPLGQVLNTTPDYNRYGNSYATDLNAGWEIDLFGGLRRGREAALADYQAAEAEMIATRLAVAARTADIYIAMRGLQTRLNIAEEQVRTQQALLEKVQLLHTKGLAPGYQVRQTEGALAQVQATVPVLRTGTDAAMNALDVMLGTPPGTHRKQLTLPGVIPQAPQITSTGTPADLLRRRPDIIVAERKLAASNASIGVAVSGYYPTFSLSALLGSATSVSGDNLFSGGASQAAGVLGLRWRLFDFGRINAQIEQAEGREAESLAAYRLSVLRASEDVENAFSSLLNSEMQTAILTRGVTALSGARQSSFIAWKQGTASLIDVLQDDENLLQASDAQAQAQTASARAAVAAFRALGGGWQPDKFNAEKL